MKPTKEHSRTIAVPLGIMLMVTLLNSIPVPAQSKLSPETHLLESGRAEKLATPAASKEIKIVSYNIRWRSGDELQQITRWLKESSETPAASIIGLQEVDRAKKRSGNVNHAKALAESLGMYYAWAAPQATKRNEKEEETGVALLSAYPLAEISRLVLTNSGPNGRSRVALGATIRIGDTLIRVYNVHAETRLPMSQKLDQMRVVLDDLANFPKAGAAIVLGDFNTWEMPVVASVRKFFTKAGFTTPLPDDEITFVTKIVVLDLKLKLDWIWVRGLAPQSYGIDRRMKVSDHFPLWITATLSNQAPNTAGQTPRRK